MDTKEKRRPAKDRGTVEKKASTPQRRKKPVRTAATKTAAAKPASAPVKRKPRREPVAKRPTPDVVYTQPGPFNRNRFLLYLISAVVFVLAIVFSMAIFFKVDQVMVSGHSIYTAEVIEQASGIQKGDNLLTISVPKASSNILSKLPYVDSVRIGIKLPDTVKIEIEELDVVYAVEAEDTSWWLMRADGVIVEKTNSADAGQYTKVVGFQIKDAVVGEQAVAAQPQSSSEESEQTTPVTVLASEQLGAAISILQYLEKFGIYGEAASVNVANLNDLEVWYGDRFQILLGDTSQLSYKIGLVKSAIDEHMESYDRGVLDASLTVQPDPEKQYDIIYTPFAS